MEHKGVGPPLTSSIFPACLSHPFIPYTEEMFIDACYMIPKPTYSPQ
jgi:hypothetical protein